MICGKHSKMRNLICWLVLVVGANLYGQNTIATLEMDDFMEDNGTYPYSFLAGERSILYKRHEPVVRISEHEFFMIYRPNEVRDRKRQLVLYTALMEETWTVEFELDDEEDIFHAYLEGEHIVLLSAKYENKQRYYAILIRRFLKESGEESTPDLLMTIACKREESFGFQLSPNDSTFLFYNYLNLSSERPIRYFMDFQQKDEAPGYRADRVTAVGTYVYNRALETQFRDTLQLSKDVDKESYVMGTWIDNHSHIYVAKVNKQQVFSLLQFPSNQAEPKTLTYENFPKFWREEDLYNLHFPPLIGNNQRVYLPILTREKEPRVGKQIEEIYVLCFDFEKKEVNQDRRIEVGPSLLVAVSKAREGWGQDPLEKFDEYLFKDLIATPDGGLMLILQRFEVSHFFNSLFSGGGRFFNFTPSGAPAITLEELLLFTFDSDGNLEKMYNVPSHQEIAVPVQLLGMHYSFYPDWENEKFYFLMHENEGEKFHKPMRLYYRELDLASGKVSERTQVFEHKRRYHFFSRPYTIWFNEHMVATLMHVTSSLSTKTFWVSIAH